MSDFLNKIRKLTEVRIAEAKAARPSLAVSSQKPHDLVTKLSQGSFPRVIAEVKRASPSQGAIALNLDPVEVARAYISEGAAVISVLTEPSYFGGSLETLANIRAALPEATLLMKDFIIDEYQLLQAREAGADAVLLMISLLGEVQFTTLYQAARDLELTPVVEVHDESELEIALAIGAPVVGINNRDLRSLEVSLDVSRRLAQTKIPGTIFISESGIETRADLEELRALGYDAFLIGSALMRKQQPGRALRELVQRTEVKICGVTRIEDAVLAARLGATMIGLIFVPSSPRCVDRETARAIVKALPIGVRAIGVFTSEASLIETVRAVGLDGVQFHGFAPSPATIEALKGKVFIQAFELEASLTSDAVENSACDFVLLDSPREPRRAPLSLERVNDLKLSRRVILAGGLTPESATLAIHNPSAQGIDLASGVEESPGLKSEQKLRHLFSGIFNKTESVYP